MRFLKKIAMICAGTVVLLPLTAGGQSHDHGGVGHHAHNTTICTNKESRLSYSGFMHCELHALYQRAFAQHNCHCSDGQCRPTQFRAVDRTRAPETGYEIMVNGEWRPIPQHALRIMDARMDRGLLTWDSHVCIGPNAVIECAWINLGG